MWICNKLTEDENSTIIISVNPTFIAIKLIIFSSSSYHLSCCSKSTSENENNTHYVYAIDFRRSTMLEYIDTALPTILVFRYNAIPIL